MTTSATGGYLQPDSTTGLGDLTLEQFLQTVMVGVSSLEGSLVRPSWQSNPPKQPDIDVNWLKIGLTEDDPDTNAYANGSQFMRMVGLSLQCSFYGPLAYEYMQLTRDNLQIKQNLEALEKARMGFVATSKGLRVPDLVNERWVNRWEMTVSFRRQILRSYPILNFVGGSGFVLANNQGSHVKTVAVSAHE